ncbi:MAG: CPXCG motif-containing cysteine-rich protein [Deltaproteobacteria bacterium]|nr:CPXCG motif-containing cysteine-rich protein [Deltaproteobacteria bacterium]
MNRQRRKRRLLRGNSTDQSVGRYTCPTCHERITVPIDRGGAAHQQYSNDCHVCCRPATLTVTIDEHGIQITAENES